MQVGFLGAGMMASALMGGCVDKKVCSPSEISCSDVWAGAREKATESGYFATESNAEVCQRATDAIILAVKPNIISSVCADVAGAGGDALIISIAAGVKLSVLEAGMPGRRVVRVMPNTPCLVGEAASGFALGSLANDSDREIVKKIFGAVGLAVEVEEKLLDAVLAQDTQLQS